MFPSVKSAQLWQNSCALFSRDLRQNKPEKTDILRPQTQKQSKWGGFHVERAVCKILNGQRKPILLSATLLQIHVS